MGNVYFSKWQMRRIVAEPEGVFMNRQLQNIIEDDYFRKYGKRKLSFIEKMKKSPQMKYLICFRKANYYLTHQKRIRSMLYKIALKKMTNKTHIQILPNTNIGKGLYIGHIGRIIINSDTVIGNNINLATGITIGQTNRGSKKGCPVIGNEVWIGTNAVIVGNITIGDDVLIAPNAYVNFDVPSHSIVMGNPAIIISKDKATQYYVENLV